MQREVLVNLVAPLVAIITIVLTALVPELEDNIEQIMPVIVTALVLVVGGGNIGQALALIFASPAIVALIDKRIAEQREAAALTPGKADDLAVDLAEAVRNVLSELAEKHKPAEPATD